MITINDRTTISAKINGVSIIIAHHRQTLDGCPLLSHTTVRQPLYGACLDVFDSAMSKTITSHNTRIIMITVFLYIFSSKLGIHPSQKAEH